MKNYFCIFVILLPVLCLAQKSKKDKKQKPFTEFGTCWDSRETTGTIESASGKIIKITEQLWAIQPDGTNTRCGFCEIPEKLKTENLKITFSGDIKKINPNERMAVAPFKIKSVTIIE